MQALMGTPDLRAVGGGRCLYCCCRCYYFYSPNKMSQLRILQGGACLCRAEPGGRVWGLGNTDPLRGRKPRPAGSGSFILAPPAQAGTPPRLPRPALGQGPAPGPPHRQRLGHASWSLCQRKGRRGKREGGRRELGPDLHHLFEEGLTPSQARGRQSRVG